MQNQTTMFLQEHSLRIERAHSRRGMSVGQTLARTLSCRSCEMFLQEHCGKLDEVGCYVAQISINRSAFPT